jgi:uncharacterized membrane protein
VLKPLRNWSRESIINLVAALCVALIAALAFTFQATAAELPRVIASMPNQVGGKLELLNTVGACKPITVADEAMHGLELRATDPAGAVRYTGCWYEVGGKLIGVIWDDDQSRMLFPREAFGLAPKLDA